MQAAALCLPPNPQCSRQRLLPIMQALSCVRIDRVGLSETELHACLSRALEVRGIAHKREIVFAKGCRADLWVDGVVIEVKKRRPAQQALLSQVTRYAGHDSVTGVIVVLERSIRLPAFLHGKPVAVISLNSLWGIAL